ncbi:MAG: tetratricopeptide repeat protein, partial [Cyanobacteria bacterium J06641_5]
MVRKGSARIPRALALVLLVGANLLSAAKCASQNSSTGAELAETGGEQIATAAEVAKKVAVKPVSPVTDIVPDDRFLAELLPLVQDPPTQRAESLAQLVAAGSPRARYLRASDALTTGSPEVALELLDGLEEEYAVLAPFVRLQQARAWKATGNLAKVLQLQSTLDRDFPESAAAAIAACDDGRPEIPRHPCSWELARQVIARDPNNFEALLRLARYQPRDSKANEWRNRLVELHSSRLSSQDWEVIAFGYWKTWEYDKAANAYEKTPSSPESLYRIARGRHLSNRKTDARRVYLQVLRDFPEAENSGWALRRLADLSTGNEALSYLDRAIDRFPARAPEALQEKAKRLEKLGNQAAAAAARQELLRDYPETDATSDYRWERARKAWLAGNLADAITWAGPAKMAKAQFWIAKWQQQQGQTEAARAQFESVLRDYPDSYYAWRSAVFLGHNVGSFNNARRFSPPLVALEGRVPLQAGSDAVSELYLLGQDRDAYGLWQYETVAKQEDFSVAEQF